MWPYVNTASLNCYVYADRFESMSYFSAIGPSLDNRIKPDILATGFTVAAKKCAPLLNKCYFAAEV